MARTICGTRTVLRTPPASRMYMLFGTVFAMVNMSARRGLLPNRKTSSISRKNPSTRDSRVPDAINALAETSDAVRPAPADVSLVAGVRVVVVSGITGVRRGGGTARGGSLGRQRRGQGAGSWLGKRGRCGRCTSDLADPEGGAAAEQYERRRGDGPAGGAVLGDPDVDGLGPANRGATGGLQLGPHRHGPVGLGGHPRVRGEVLAGPDQGCLDRFDGQPL